MTNERQALIDLIDSNTLENWLIAVEIAKGDEELNTWYVDITPLTTKEYIIARVIEYQMWACQFPSPNKISTSSLVERIKQFIGKDGRIKEYALEVEPYYTIQTKEVEILCGRIELVVIENYLSANATYIKSLNIKPKNSYNYGNKAQRF